MGKQRNQERMVKEHLAGKHVRAIGGCPLCKGKGG